MLFQGIIFISRSTPSSQASCNPRYNVRPSGSFQARLELTTLDQVVDVYFQHGLAESTQRSYNSAKPRFRSFCVEQSCLTLPVSELQLCKFASYLALQDLPYSTIKCYLSAIRHLQIEILLGGNDPKMQEMAKLELALKSIKQLQASLKGSPKQKLQYQLHQVCCLQVWEKAVVCLCFLAFLGWGNYDSYPRRL